MGKQYQTLNADLIKFINDQKLFFVATATADSKINLSPKGMDSFRVINDQQVAWLNLTGSGNETCAHLQHTPRITIMFCAFSGKPLILRLYGQAKVIHANTKDWPQYYTLFTPLPGARQIIVVDLELVQSSCGKAVPYFDFVAEREQLNEWAKTKGEQEIKRYWQKNNSISLDGETIDIPD